VIDVCDETVVDTASIAYVMSVYAALHCLSVRLSVCPMD